MSIRWSVPLPGPFSVSGNLPGGKAAVGAAGAAVGVYGGMWQLVRMGLDGSLSGPPPTKASTVVYTIIGAAISWFATIPFFRYLVTDPEAGLVVWIIAAPVWVLLALITLYTTVIIVCAVVVAITRIPARKPRVPKAVLDAAKAEAVRTHPVKGHGLTTRNQTVHPYFAHVQCECGRRWSAFTEAEAHTKAFPHLEQAERPSIKRQAEIDRMMAKQLGRNYMATVSHRDQIEGPPNPEQQRWAEVERLMAEQSANYAALRDSRR